VAGNKGFYGVAFLRVLTTEQKGRKQNLEESLPGIFSTLFPTVGRYVSATAGKVRPCLEKFKFAKKNQ
jgi:hypothetical protein